MLHLFLLRFRTLDELPSKMLASRGKAFRNGDSTG